MYRYETHLHTFPVSKCGKVTVREALEFYKKIDYDGVFITNHFIDGNINFIAEDTDSYDSNRYEKLIDFYFSDYEEGLLIGKEIGLRVFFGNEISYKGTDFLIYGLGKEWYLSHPEILEMKKSQVLPYYMEHGALVIQAHPFREARYIDHIRLFPRCVHGVEIYNACRTDFENEMARQYAENYSLLPFAGSDNHVGAARPLLGGMESDAPVHDELDFVGKVLSGEMRIFKTSNPLLS